MLIAATPNDSELADIEYRRSELAARHPETELCATCGLSLPLVYRVRPDEAYCANCSRHPRLYASTIAIVNAALRNASRFPQWRSDRAAHSRTDDTRAHEQIASKRSICSGAPVARTDIICGPRTQRGLERV